VIVLYIKGKLIAQSINKGDKLESNTSRAKINLIIKELKTKLNYYAVFNKALITEKSLKNINLTIYQLV
jgi:hypothetical protein